MKKVNLPVKHNKAVICFFIVFSLLYLVMSGGLNIASDRLFDVLSASIPYDPDEVLVVDGVETEPFWDMLIELYEPLEDRIVWDSSIAILIAAALSIIAAIKLSGQRLLDIFMRCAALVSALSVLVIWLAGSTALLSAGVFSASFFAAFALGLLLWRMAGQLPPGKAGLTIGCGFALLTGLNVALSPTYWDPPVAVIAVAMFASAVIAAFLPLPRLADAPQAGNAKVSAVPSAAGFIAAAAALMFLCGTVSDIMSNHLFYFWEVYYIMPYLLFASIQHVFTVLVCLLSGFLFDRYTKINGFLAALLSLGVCQAMILFFEAPWMGVPYYLFRILGGRLSAIFIVALPVYYASQGSKKMPPQAGLMIMSLYTIAVRLSFRLINPETYELGSTVFNTGLGIVLLLTFAALALFFVLLRLQEKHERAVAIAAVKSYDSGSDAGDSDAGDSDAGDSDAGDKSRAPQISDIRRKLTAAALEPLTPRELEVAELTVLGIKRKIIADTLFVQSSTVDSHRISIYNKFGVRTRDELLKKLAL